MRLNAIRQRVQSLENALADFRPEQRSTGAGLESCESSSWMAQLSDLAQETISIFKRADNRGDDRTALAAVPEVCRIFELIAKLSGKLNEKPTTNVLNVNLDPETAQQITEIYVKRHKSLIEEDK